MEPIQNERKDLVSCITLSLACNMRHNFCYQSCFSQEMLSHDVLYNKLKPVYENSALLNLIGGEVTILSGMDDYIPFVRSCNSTTILSLVTNGLAFDSRWIELCMANNVLVNYSLDATNADIAQTLIDKGRYPYQKIWENFLALSDSHRTAEFPLINCISMVVTPSSVVDIIPFIRLGLRHGVNVQILYSNNEKVPWNDKIRISLYEAIKFKVFCADYIDVKLLNFPPLYNNLLVLNDIVGSPAYQKEKQDFLNKIEPVRSRNRYSEWSYGAFDHSLTRCLLPWNGFLVLPDGDVLPCCNLNNYPIGNINFQSFDEIVTSESASCLRQLLIADDYRYCWNNCRCNMNCQTSINNLQGGYQQEATAAFERGDYNSFLLKISGWPDQHFSATQLYHKAFALHSQKEHDAALKYYQAALDKGFSEFWVRYNRGSLLLDLERPDEAKADLARAHELDPHHEGAKQQLAAAVERIQAENQAGKLINLLRR
ncbi:MAG: SPASM domain-containing protein [Desulfovibrio sp.]|jgi:MoaA/NifB/PqqE/SkfB family radical SAM enzyme|nr:SPASM domain-containing protein [Desulfovibrio sp.]